MVLWLHSSNRTQFNKYDLENVSFNFPTNPPPTFTVLSIESRNLNRPILNKVSNFVQIILEIRNYDKHSI